MLLKPFFYQITSRFLYLLIFITTCLSIENPYLWDSTSGLYGIFYDFKGIEDYEAYYISINSDMLIKLKHKKDPFFLFQSPYTSSSWLHKEQIQFCFYTEVYSGCYFEFHRKRNNKMNLMNTYIATNNGLQDCIDFRKVDDKPGDIYYISLSKYPNENKNKNDGKLSLLTKFFQRQCQWQFYRFYISGLIKKFNRQIDSYPTGKFDVPSWLFSHIE